MLTGCILNRWDDLRRRSSDGCPDLECTERPGSPIDDSTAIDHDGSRSGEPTGNSSRRSSTDEGSSLYRGVANERLDFRFGGPRPPVRGGSTERIADITAHSCQLYTSIRSFFPGVSGPEELEVCESQLGVDWPFDKPVTDEDWLQFFYFFRVLCGFNNLL